MPAESAGLRGFAIIEKRCSHDELAISADAAGVAACGRCIGIKIAQQRERCTLGARAEGGGIFDTQKRGGDEDDCASAEHQMSPDEVMRTGCTWRSRQSRYQIWR